MYDPSEALLQLGLYDYVWGDPGLLNTYNSNVQAEKARQENLAYQNMWKQIEQNKINAENAKAEEQARKDKEAKLAELYKQYNNAAGEQERAYIAKQINALEGNKSVESEMLAAFNADRAAKEQADRDEALRHSAALREIADIEAKSRKLKKAKDKDALANAVYDTQIYPNMNTAERDKLYSYLKGIKTLDEKITDSVENAAAAHSGKKAGESLDEKDLAEKYQKMYLENKILTPKQEQIRSKYFGAK